jgi:large subunit ribosomal protein L25
MSDFVEVKLRKETGTRASRRLRREGLVPAVLYGHGEKCVDLAARREALEAALRIVTAIEAAQQVMRASDESACA